MTSKSFNHTIKILWAASEYEAGMESELKVDVTNIHDGPNDLIVTDPRQACFETFTNCQIHTAFIVQSPGCWKITGSFREASLSFVVKTVSEKQDAL